MQLDPSTAMPTILIIVGITGDLTKRKLLPAIEAISKAGALPDKFHILGTTRQASIDREALCANIPEASYVPKHLEIFTMDAKNQDEYIRLGAHLKKIEKQFSSPAQRLFYLSVPPKASQSIIEMLGKSGLAKIPDTKLLLEKPFGVDLNSATEIIKHIDAWFAPEQVYRIDHYLAKEMTQNLIVFREYNSLFRRTWNKEYIERIEITAKEKIGIEERVDFYEQAGALRDLVQSHLLQLTALTLMGPATLDDQNEDAKDIPLRRLKALKQLRIAKNKTVQEVVMRGQYESYKNEVQNLNSTVETFVSLTLESSDQNFIGIPIILTTGKMLDEKVTEIRIFYKKDRGKEANELVLRVQPNEGVFMSLWSKRPGYEEELEKTTLEFTYSAHRSELSEAYEKVLVDTMRSDHHLFVSSEEVLESWKILAPIQEMWAKTSKDLIIYKNGSFKLK